VELAEFLGPGLSGQVGCGDLSTIVWVLDVRGVVQLTGVDVLGEQLTGTVAKQLVQGNLQSE
jgi:hypothetical protein